jgi:dihydropteroate synthase
LASPRNLPPSDRLPATIAATTIAALNGASFIRTHDVKPTHDALHALSQTEEQ